MTKRNITKKALLASVLSFIICLSMLIGTTFAWFTDTDTAEASNIVVGTLDIEILDAQGNEKDTPLVFVNAEGSADIKWEPNATFRTEGFILKNSGNLNLKYKIEINNTEASYNILNEVISFSVVYADGSAVALNDVALAPSGESDVMFIEGHMDSAAGNKYKGLTLTGVSITVYATQQTAEKDMTNDQYDKNATYPVANAAEFNNAIANAKDGDVVILKDDIKVDSFIFTNGSEVAIDGNGKTIELGTRAVISGQENVTLDGIAAGSQITVRNTHFKSADGQNFAAIFGPANGDGASIVFDGCTFEDLYAPVYCGIQMGGATIDVTIKNCTYINTKYTYALEMASFYDRNDYTYNITLTDNIGVEGMVAEIFQ